MKRECVNTSLADAVARVDNYQLTAYYSQKTGKVARQRVAALR